MEDVLELTRQLGRKPNVDTALSIIQWELGGMVKANTYAKWHPPLKEAYMTDLAKNLADMVFQCRVIASLLNVPFAETIRLGEVAVGEKIRDKERKVDRFKHYVGDKEGD